MRTNYRFFILALVSALLGACSAPRPPAHAGTLVASTGMRSGVASKATQEPSGRHIIRSAVLELESDAVRKVAKRVMEAVEQYGGHVENSSDGESSAYVRPRVPAARFGEALARLKRLAKVREVRIRGEDVTTRVVDLELRLKTARAAHARYLELLQRAKNVAEALPVQKELQAVVAEIERLEGEVKGVRRLVQQATIDVNISTPVRPGPVGWVFYGIYRGFKWLFVWD